MRIEEFARFALGETDCRVLEAYSVLGQELRSFDSFESLASAFEIGVDPMGHGVAQQLVLWSNDVIPPPTIRRFEVKVEGQNFRYAAEGCGLFYLQLGGAHAKGITESSLGYWSEAGARNRCGAYPRRRKRLAIPDGYRFPNCKFSDPSIQAGGKRKLFVRSPTHRPLLDRTAAPTAWRLN